MDCKGTDRIQKKEEKLEENATIKSRQFDRGEIAKQKQHLLKEQPLLPIMNILYIIFKKVEHFKQKNWNWNKHIMTLTIRLGAIGGWWEVYFYPDPYVNLDTNILLSN